MHTAIGLTDTDQIRGVMGLSQQDLPDKAMLSRKLDTEIKLDLMSWVPNSQALYAASKLNTATDTERAIGEALGLYSAYYCAALVARSGPLLVAQQISDGKNSLSRFTPISWDKIQADMLAQAAKYKGLVNSLLAVDNPLETAGMVLFQAVGLAVDPVTDTGAGG